MISFRWFSEIFADWHRRQRLRRAKQWHYRMQSQPGVMALEPRRVLNAAPMIPVPATPPAEVVIDAGKFANDGKADTFVVTRSAAGDVVSVNGKVQQVVPAGQKIVIEGSNDADIVEIDLSNGNPVASSSISFAGNGGSDSVQLVGSASEVTHQFAADGSGRIIVDGGSINYSAGVSVTDSLTVNVRTFEVAGSENLAVGDSTTEGMDEVKGQFGHDVQFVETAVELRIDVNQSTATANTVTIGDLDSNSRRNLTIDGDSQDTVHLPGTIELHTGDLKIDAGTIDISGHVTTESADVTLNATSKLTVETGASVSNQSGSIIADAGSTGTLLVSGTLDVSNLDAGRVGGAIHLLGHDVGLTGATIDARGDAGGGTILVGGDYQGKNPNIRNASRTVVDKNTTLNASAINNGNGGKVIVWSNDATTYAGTILATGGTSGGNGGQSEVSGSSLAFGGYVNLSAANGHSGTLLLDPKNIVVTDGGASDINTNQLFTDNAAADATFDADQLTAILDNGTDLTLQANNNITIDEDVIVNNPVGNGGKLTLQAGQSIFVNANITTDNGDFSATANETLANGVVDANRDAGTAVITVAAGKTINAGSGAVTLHLSTGAGLTNHDSGDITLGSITAGSLDVKNDLGAIVDNSTLIVIANNASFRGTSITIGGAGKTTNFVSLTFNSIGAVSIQEDANMLLTGSNSANSLNLSSTGTIRDDVGTSLTVTNNATFNGTLIRLADNATDMLDVGGTADFESSGTIRIGNQGTSNFGSLTFNSSSTVRIQEDSTTVLVGSNTANRLLLFSSGSITDNSTGLDVTLDASLAATSISIGGAGTTTNFGTVQFNSGGAVSIQEDSDTVLAATNTANSLDLISAGAITDGSASLAVTNNAHFNGTSVSVGGAGTTTNFGSLSFNSTGNVTIQEDSSTALEGANTAGSVSLTSSADIVDDPGASFVVTNNASFSGTSITLDNAAANAFGTLTFNSAGAATFVEKDATNLTGANTAASLTVTSASSIADDAGATLTITNNASFSGTSISFDNANANAYGTLTFNSAGAVTIVEKDATNLSGASTAGTLSLTSTSSIADDAGTTLVVTNNASFSGTAITLDNAAANSYGTLTFTSAGAVTIVEKDATNLTGANTASSFSLTAAGSIVDDPGATLTVTDNASFSGTSITLDNAVANAFGTLTFNSAGTVTVVEKDATNLTGVSTAASLSLTSANSIVDDPGAALTVTNNANFSGTSIALDNAAANSYGTLTFNSAGAVTIVEKDDTNLAGASTAGSLSLTSAASITDDPGATLVVTNNASLNGTSITLDNSNANAFGTLTFNSAGVVTVVEKDSANLSGGNTASSLNLTSSASIVDDPGATLIVTNNASFSGTSITLDNAAANAYGTLTFNSAGAVSIIEKDASNLAGSSTAGSLSLTSAAGIVDDAGATLAVTNNASFSGTSITLDNANANSFGSLTFNSAGAVTLVEKDATNLTNASTAASLSLTSAAGIVDNAGATLTVTNNASFSGSSITLDNAAANSYGTLTFNSAGAVTIVEKDATNLAGANTASSLSLTSAGSIADDAGSTLTVANNADFSGTSITLDNANASAYGTLTFNSAGSATIVEKDATNLENSSTAGSLNLTSAAGIVDDPGATLVVANDASFSGTSITLDNSNANAFGTLTFNSAGAVTLVEKDTTNLSGASTAASLSLTSAAAIVDDPGATLAVTNNASFGGASIALDNANANAYGALTFNSAGAVTIIEKDSTNLSGASTAGSLSLTSVAGIVDDAGATLAVANSASFSGTSITLDNANANAFGTLTFNSAGAVTIVEKDAMNLVGGSTASGLSLTSAAEIVDDPGATLVVTNNANFGGTSITLDNVNANAYGTLTFNSTGAVTIVEKDATNLAGANTAGSFSLTSTAGISDDAGATLTVANNASFSGTSITLDNANANAYGSLTFNSTGAVTLVEKDATNLTGTSTAGSLNLTSAASIVDDSGATLLVTNNASFSGTSITLDNVNANAYGTLTFNSAGAVTIAEKDAMNLAAASTAGSLNLTSAASIVDNAGATLVVTSDATFSGTSITLDNANANSYGTLTFNSAGAVTIVEKDATNLANASTGNSLSLTSAVSIVDDLGSTLAVTNSASFSGTSITLDNPNANAFGTLTFNSAGAVTIAEKDATNLAGASTAGSLSMTSAAGIVDDAGATLTVANNASFSGTSIALDNANANAYGTLTFNSAGAVTIVEKDATNLTGDSTADNLNLTSASSIADDPGATLVVVNNASFSGTSITLDNPNANAYGTLTFNSAGAVTIVEKDATNLAGASTAGSLNLTSAAGIVDDPGATLVVTNNATFSGSSIALDNANANSYGTLTFNSSGAVTFVEKDTTNLTGASTAVSLALTSASSIVDDAGATLAVTNNASFSGTSITLDNANANAFGTLAFNSAGAVTIVEKDATNLAGASTADSLSLTSAASIVDNAGATLVVTNNANFSGTSITLDNAAANAYGTLTFNSTGAVTIVEKDDTNLAAANTASSLSLTSVAGIADDAGATLTVTNNAKFSGTSVTLDNANANAFGSLTFNSTGTVAIVEKDATILAGANTAGSLNLTSAGSITEPTGTVTAADIRLDAGGAIGASSERIQLDATNLAAKANGGIHIEQFAAGDLTINTVGAITGLNSSSANGDIEVQVDGGKLNVNGTIQAGLGTVRLKSSSDITQTQGITATSLGAVSTAGNINLNSASNNVAHFAAEATAGGKTINYRDTDSVQLDTVTAGGVFAGDISGINVGTTAGSTVRLRSGGDITQTSTSPVIADQFGIEATGNIDLCPAANDVNSLAASAGGLLVFNDIDTFSIASTITAGSTLSANLTGLNASDIELISDGNLVVDSEINIAGKVILISKNGSVTQTAKISATQLAVQAKTFVDLSTQINNVDEFAATAAQYVRYRDADSVAISSILGDVDCQISDTTGITTTTGDIEVRAATNISVEKTISAGDTVRLWAENGTVTQTATANILAQSLSVQANGLIDLCESSNNDVITFAATSTAGSVYYRDANSIVIGTVNGGICVAATQTGLSAGQDAEVRTNVDISIQQKIAATGTVRLWGETGTVAQNANGNIIATSLSVHAKGLIDLCQSTTNDVDNFAATSDTSSVYLSDKDNVVVGQVAGGATCVTAIQTGITAAADAEIHAGTDISVQQHVSATHNVRLWGEGGQVTQNATGNIVTTNLSVHAKNLIDLCQSTNNDVDTFAATSDTNSVYLSDKDNVIIGQVAGGTTCVTAAQTGVTAVQDAEIHAGTDISIQQQISAVSNVRLWGENGDVTQNATGNIVTTNLSVQAKGLIDLSPSANNDVSILAANGTTVRFFDKNTFAIGTVTGGVSCVTGTVIDITAPVEIDLKTGNNFDVNRALSSSTIRLQSNTGSLTQSATITANSLIARANNHIDLCTQVNDVGTFAAEAATGYVYFQDLNSVTVGTVSGSSCIAAASGITAGTDVEIHAGTDITILENIISDDHVRLWAVAGKIAQGANGVIDTDQLLVRAGSDIQLNGVTNKVSVIAATATGAIDFLNQGTLSISTVVGGTCVMGDLDGVTSTTGSTINITTNNLPGNTDGILNVLSPVNSTGAMGLTGQHSVALASNVGSSNTSVVTIQATDASISRTAGMVTAQIVNLKAGTSIGSGTINTSELESIDNGAAKGTAGNDIDWSSALGGNPTGIYVSTAMLNVSSSSGPSTVNGDVWVDLNPLANNASVEVTPLSATGNVVITSGQKVGEHTGSIRIDSIVANGRILIYTDSGTANGVSLYLGSIVTTLVRNGTTNLNALAINSDGELHKMEDFDPNTPYHYQLVTGNMLLTQLEQDATSPTNGTFDASTVGGLNGIYATNYNFFVIQKTFPSPTEALIKAPGSNSIIATYGKGAEYGWNVTIDWGDGSGGSANTITRYVSKSGDATTAATLTANVQQNETAVYNISLRVSIDPSISLATHTANSVTYFETHVLNTTVQVNSQVLSLNIFKTPPVEIGNPIIATQITQLVSAQPLNNVQDEIRVDESEVQSFKKERYLKLFLIPEDGSAPIVVKLPIDGALTEKLDLKILIGNELLEQFTNLPDGRYRLDLYRVLGDDILDERTVLETVITNGTPSNPLEEIIDQLRRGLDNDVKQNSDADGAQLESVPGDETIIVSATEIGSTARHRAIAKTTQIDEQATLIHATRQTTTPRLLMQK